MSLSFQRYSIIRIIFPELTSVIVNVFKEKFPEYFFTEMEILFITAKILGHCYVSHVYKREPNLYNKGLKDNGLRKRRPRKPLLTDPKKLTAEDVRNIESYFPRNRAEIIDFYHKRQDFFAQKEKDSKN